MLKRLAKLQKQSHFFVLEVIFLKKNVIYMNI